MLDTCETLRLKMLEVLKIAFVLGVPFAELFSGGCAVASGLWLVNPYLNTYAASPTYAALRALPLSEGTFGAVVAGMGAVQIAGVLREWVSPRWGVAYGGVLFWSLMAAMSYWSNPPSLAAIFYFMLTLTQVMVVRHYAGRRRR